ncbi:MAG: DHH family phosphoesterase [Defluviitaleaceae bacterium]|nr:DHH family phosphoesterase [Defluviitaleaceae bacterium]
MSADEGAKRAPGVIVGLILIDNYDDVLDSLEEYRHPVLLAMIDRKISAMARQTQGIVKKFERDKYLFIFPADKLDYFIETKTGFISQIRGIGMASKLPPTLSIGLGMGADSLTQLMDYARASLDLALGRGGDQLLIKDPDKYYFYGGKARESTQNSRVRARVKAYALTELIEEASSVIVMGHRAPDLDCLGSAAGVYRIAQTMGKKGYIVFNDATSATGAAHDRLLKEQEYGSVFVTSEKAMEMMAKDTLLVIVDTHRASLLEHRPLYQAAKKVVVLDHHRKSAEAIENTVMSYHEPFASSTCELVTELVTYVNANVQLKEAEADALLAGITVDTKNFSLKTGARTFEAAAFLQRNGADTMRVRMLLQNDMSAFKAKSITVNTAETFMGNMAVSVCPSDAENPSLTTAQAADELLNISGIIASFVLCENAVDDEVLVSARSLGEVNVQEIMEKFGGGGHQTAAGAQVRGMTLEETREELKMEIEKYLRIKR